MTLFSYRTLPPCASSRGVFCCLWQRLLSQSQEVAIVGTVIFFDQEAFMAELQDMWQCQVGNCGYIYNPDKGDRKHKIPAGTKFEDLPDDWRCPVCGSTKKMFRRLSEVQS